MRSSTREMTITATKVIVAFHTMSHTRATFARSTTPRSSATTAPPAADQPMERPLGWAITKVKVTAKIATATAVNVEPAKVTTGEAGLRSLGSGRPARGRSRSGRSTVHGESGRTRLTAPQQIEHRTCHHGSYLHLGGRAVAASSGASGALLTRLIADYASFPVSRPRPRAATRTMAVDATLIPSPA